MGKIAVDEEVELMEEDRECLAIDFVNQFWAESFCNYLNLLIDPRDTNARMDEANDCRVLVNVDQILDSEMVSFYADQFHCIRKDGEK